MVRCSEFGIRFIREINGTKIDNFNYTKRINFTCNHDSKLYKERKNPTNRTKSLRNQCDKITSNTFKDPRLDIHPIATEQRSEYCWKNSEYKFHRKGKASDIAYGIVPDAFGWSRFPKLN